jgi:hypothetical protein
MIPIDSNVLGRFERVGGTRTKPPMCLRMERSCLDVSFQTYEKGVLRMCEVSNQSIFSVSVLRQNVVTKCSSEHW